MSNISKTTLLGKDSTLLHQTDTFGKSMAKETSFPVLSS